MRSCVAPDDTIWSFGSTGYNKSDPRPGDTLRHFDIHKGQIGSFLPRSTLPAKPPDALSYIRCTATEVMVYSTRASRFIEMKYDDHAPRVYAVANAPSGPGLKLIGFASLGPKRVFGLYNRLGHYGLYQLEFNDAANTTNWQLVDKTEGECPQLGVVTGLWGSDEDKLVISRAEDYSGVAALHWAAPR
jgi:hypothetical protein